MKTPINYHDIVGIEKEIKPNLDVNTDGKADFGLCIIALCDLGEGDNHIGYMGFRDPLNNDIIKDYGVMNVVVKHWLS